eukprot:scaffold657964_cov47-Prasinocladus_malaysianus.AAC.1
MKKVGRESGAKLYWVEDKMSAEQKRLRKESDDRVQQMVTTRQPESLSKMKARLSDRQFCFVGDS